MTAAERPAVDQISAEAAEIAANNPPSRVLLTCVLGVFAGVGWLAGRIWLAVAGFAAFAGLAVKYGYRNGAKVPTQPRPTTRPANSYGLEHRCDTAEFGRHVAVAVIIDGDDTRTHHVKL